MGKSPGSVGYKGESSLATYGLGKLKPGSHSHTRSCHFSWRGVRFEASTMA